MRLDDALYDVFVDEDEELEAGRSENTSEMVN